MSAKLKILDLNGQEIDISKGFDFGTCQVNRERIIKFKIQNASAKKAKGITLASEPLNTVEEVGQVEYDKQLQASKWKSFSIEEEGPYTTTLNLGDVMPGKFVEGTKTTPTDFSSEQSSNWGTVWETGVTEYEGERHKFSKPNGVHEGIMGKRMRNNDIQSARDIELEMCMEFVTTIEGQSGTLPFIAIPCRINSNGDGKGYMFMFRYRRTDSTFKVSIYKEAKGMISYEDREYGTSFLDTIEWLPFEAGKKITFKLYNNEKNQPSFEIKYDGQNIKIGKIGDSGSNGFVMSDTMSSAYKEAGGLYWDTSLYDGDYSVATYELVLKTEELEQPICMRTVISEDSINRAEYLTATTITYIES